MFVANLVMEDGRRIGVFFEMKLKPKGVNYMWIKVNIKGFLSCLLFCAWAMVGCTPEKQEDGKSLNVILILADDLGYGDIEPYGQTIIHTPNLNRLRDRGMLFTQCYSGSVLSAPSRCSLMTGLHTGHTFVRGNKRAFPDRLAYSPGSTLEGQVAMPKNTYTLADVFKQKGYETGCFGMWGLGYPGSESDPIQAGFDRFFGYNCQFQARNHYPDHLWDGLMRISLPGNDTTHLVYSDDTIHHEAMSFIRANAERAFFAYLPYTQPHANLAVPHDSIYEAYCNEIPVEDDVPFVSDSDQTWQYADCERPLATYASMVTRLDRYVGEIMDLVDSLGIADHTMIVFTSDNGSHRHGGANPEYFGSYGQSRGKKQELYDGCLHIPLIISCPGVVAEGSESNHMMAFWDMMPTCAEMIGADLMVKSDGISFLPTLTGKGTQIEHNYLYWEYHEKDGKQAVREGIWKGIVQHVGTPAQYFELFDLSVDPHEDHDVAEMYPGVVGHLQQLIDFCHVPSDLFNFGQ